MSTEEDNKRRIDILFKRYDALSESNTWQESFLQNELGYRPKPDSPVLEGNVNKRIREETEKILAKWRVHELIIKGPENAWGLESKVKLLWGFLIPIWAFIGGAIATGLKELLKKIF